MTDVSHHPAWALIVERRRYLDYDSQYALSQVNTHLNMLVERESNSYIRQLANRLPKTTRML